MSRITGDTPTPVIATRDVTVEDANMGIKRKIFAGTQVPADLVKPYLEETGETAPKPGSATPPAEAITSDYDSHKAGVLEAEIERRRTAGREIEVEGTGQGGKAVKADYVAALTADDER